MNMHFRHGYARLTGFVVLALAVSGCSSSTVAPPLDAAVTESGSDATTDAHASPLPDAETDAIAVTDTGTDAEMDAGAATDAGTDTGTDAGLVSGVGGPCGGFTTMPHTCAPGLVCVFHGVPDLPGTCEPLG